MPTGILKKWLGDKGFGFITPDDGTADLFAHIRQKAGVPDEPITEGRRVSYEFELDLQKGKPKAVSWSFMEGGALAPVGVGAPVGSYTRPPTAAVGMGTRPGGPCAGGVTPAAVAQIASASGVDYQALVQAANAAAAAIAAGGGVQAAGDSLLANLVGLAGGLAAGGVAMQAPAVQMPTPPAPMKHIQEEVEVPTQFVAEIIGQAGAGLEEIKRRAGGDISIELSATEMSDSTRMVKIRGPAVSASLGALLVSQRVAEVVV